MDFMKANDRQGNYAKALEVMGEKSSTKRFRYVFSVDGVEVDDEALRLVLTPLLFRGVV
ncbi:MAG: hypothetical protein LBO00_08775 [Zoogloeaceae bacterium]|jgi:hypothetical protein|nr:hypothetical protein [Zoogloeaceae bacterium]